MLKRVQDTTLEAGGQGPSPVKYGGFPPIYKVQSGLMYKLYNNYGGRGGAAPP